MTAEKASEAKKMALAMLGGLSVGLLLFAFDKSEWVGYIRPIGDIFLRLLMMLIVPLVASSLFMSVVNLGGAKKLGVLGITSFGYFMFSTSLAVFFGLVIARLIRPGLGMDISHEGVATLDGLTSLRIEQSESVLGMFSELLVRMIPANPMQALVQVNVLQIIVFAMIFGLVALMRPREAEPLVKLMGSIEKLTLTLTNWVMRLAPYGVFALTCDVIARTGMHALNPLSRYVMAVGLGLLLHGFLLLLLAASIKRCSPLKILRATAEALLTAFSTASSAATLPVTVRCAEENLEQNRQTTHFVAPLGATINMDGTALYSAVAAIFIADAYLVELGSLQMVVIFATAALASLSTAAIPSAGLISLGLVLNAVGLPLEGVGLIVAVDRLLDMSRTTVNVFSDMVSIIVVDFFRNRSKI